MTYQKKAMSPEEREFYKALGERLARRREEVDLTQAEVAATLRVAQQTYAAYETARARFPLFLLPRLMEILVTDMDFLLGIPAKNAPSRRPGGRR